MKKGKGRGDWVLFKFSFQQGRSLFKVGNLIKLVWQMLTSLEKNKTSYKFIGILTSGKN